MKNHQMLMLMSMILFAPFNNEWVSVTLGVICLGASIYMSHKE